MCDWLGAKRLNGMNGMKYSEVVVLHIHFLHSSVYSVGAVGQAV